MTDSDQALAVYNAMLKGLRTVDPMATQCYLAYQKTRPAPATVKPADGIFLEYAPFDRDFTRSMADASCEKNVIEGEPLPALLKLFGRKGAKVLEYWLDNSLFSRWKKPPVLLKPNDDVIRADLADYDAMGFEVVTTFACFLGSDYEELHGGLPDMRSYLCGRSTT
jgi:hypothetical protein